MILTDSPPNRHFRYQVTQLFCPELRKSTSRKKITMSTPWPILNFINWMLNFSAPRFHTHNGEDSVWGAGGRKIRGGGDFVCVCVWGGGWPPHCSVPSIVRPSFIHVHVGRRPQQRPGTLCLVLRVPLYTRRMRLIGAFLQVTVSDRRSSWLIEDN